MKSGRGRATGRVGWQSEEGVEKTLCIPCRPRTRCPKRRHTRAAKRKGVVDRLAGRLVPLFMHADGLALY